MKKNIFIAFILMLFAGDLSANEKKISKPPIPQLCTSIIEKLASESNFPGVDSPLSQFSPPSLDEYQHQGGNFFSPTIKKQCGFGSCWAQSSMQVYENRALQNGSEVTLSAEYMIAVSTLEKFLRQAEDHLKNTDETKKFVNQGNSRDQTLSLIRKYGLMPDSAWSPKRRVSGRSVENERLINTVRVLQVQFYERISSVKEKYKKADMKKKYIANLKKAKSTDTAYILKLEAAVKDYNALLTELGLSEETGLVEMENVPMALNAIEEYSSLVWGAVVGYFGEPPAQFSWDNNTYTATEFATEDIFKFWSQERGIHPSLISVSSEGISNREGLFPVIRKMLDHRELVWTSLDWQSAISDFDTGLISAGAYNPLEVSLPSYFEAIGEGKGHAVVLVDYKLGESGRPEWLLIKNSWGEDRGDQGYFHIDWQTFTHIFKGIVIPRHLEQDLQ